MRISTLGPIFLLAACEGEPGELRTPIPESEPDVAIPRIDGTQSVGEDADLVLDFREPDSIIHFDPGAGMVPFDRYELICPSGFRMNLREWFDRQQIYIGVDFLFAEGGFFLSAGPEPKATTQTEECECESECSTCPDGLAVCTWTCNIPDCMRRRPFLSDDTYRQWLDDRGTHPLDLPPLPPGPRGPEGPGGPTAPDPGTPPEPGGPGGSGGGSGGGNSSGSGSSGSSGGGSGLNGHSGRHGIGSGRPGL